MIYIEWRVAGRFVHPGFLNDDLLVEPSQSQIETAGVLVYAFGPERVAGQVLLRRRRTARTGPAPAVEDPERADT